MDRCALSATVEFACDDLFAISICEKVYAPGWDNANQSRTEAFEESRKTLISIYVSVWNKNQIGE